MDLKRTAHPMRVGVFHARYGCVADHTKRGSICTIGKDSNSILNCQNGANDTVGRYDSGKGNDDFP